MSSYDFNRFSLRFLSWLRVFVLVFGVFITVCALFVGYVLIFEVPRARVEQKRELVQFEQKLRECQAICVKEFPLSHLRGFLVEGPRGCVCKVDPGRQDE